jgi:glycosyltransferase involved in cell wall biosynthesis
MKLLILSQYFPPEIGAAQARLAAVARELVHAGHSVEVLTALPNYPTGKIFPQYRGCFYKQDVHEHTKVHRTWSYASQGSGLARMFNYASFAATAFLGLVRCHKPNCILIELPPLSLAIPGILAAKIWRVPVIVNVSDLWPDSALELGILREGLLTCVLRQLERWTYAEADYVCAVTQSIKETLASHKNVPDGKILFLPNGVDTALLTPVAPDPKLQARLGLGDKKLVLYTGTHSLAHGLDVLLEAAKVLQNEPEFHFVFVGSGSAKRKLMDRAQILRLKNVSFLDPIPPEEVAKLYSIALCGIVSLRDIPILQCARPAKTLAIMACGKPVIFVSRSLTSVVSDAKAGIVVDSADPTSVAAAVRRLGRDPELAAHLGRNGRAYVEQYCTWSLLVGNWLRQLAQTTRTDNSRLINLARQV